MIYYEWYIENTAICKYTNVFIHVLKWKAQGETNSWDRIKTNEFFSNDQKFIIPNYTS